MTAAAGVSKWRVFRMRWRKLHWPVEIQDAFLCVRAGTPTLACLSEARRWCLLARRLRGHGVGDPSEAALLGRGSAHRGPPPRAPAWELGKGGDECAQITKCFQLLDASHVFYRPRLR